MHRIFPVIAALGTLAALSALSTPARAQFTIQYSFGSGHVVQGPDSLDVSAVTGTTDDQSLFNFVEFSSKLPDNPVTLSATREMNITVTGNGLPASGLSRYFLDTVTVSHEGGFNTYEGSTPSVDLGGANGLEYYLRIYAPPVQTTHGDIGGTVQGQATIYNGPLIAPEPSGLAISVVGALLIGGLAVRRRTRQA